MKTKYKELVKKAKLILKGMDKSKHDIADLAIRACKIKLGGHLDGCYTLSNFADDAGIPRQTLSSWVQNRKIQKTIKKSRGVDIKSGTDLRRIREIMASKNIDGENRVTKYNNAKAVGEAYEVVAKISPEDKYINHAISKVSSIKFNLGTYQLKRLDSNKVVILDKLLKDCVKIIKKGGVK